MGFFNLQKKITFIPYVKELLDVEAPPVSASSKLPEWYKKLPQYVNNSDKPVKALGQKDLKTCVPFRDAMITGYLLVTPADLEVAIDEHGNISVFWNQGLPFVVVHKRGPLAINNQGYGMPHPLGTSPTMFAWHATWGIETSKADSVLVTHPLNRHDLPFVTTSGIMDSGYINVAGNIPFFFKEGFEGIIPKGTPYAQVIPFQRNDWTSSLGQANQEEYLKTMTLRDSYLNGFYSRFLRQPKNYK
jgi:hypothetical protein